MRITLAGLLPVLLILACNNVKQRASEEYLQEIESWHKQRIESLTSDSGWLTLAGLYWLDEGENSFGSAKDNDMVFPEGKAPDKVGTLSLNNGQVTVTVLPDVPVEANGEKVTNLVLQSDENGAPTVLSLGPLSWYVIKRGERYGVRLKDKTSPVLLQFKGIDRFPVDSTYRVKARLRPYEQPKKIKVPTVIGMSEESSPGVLEFTLHGKQLTLQPLAEAGSKSYFIIFADETSGKETYGGGRFLYADAAGPDSTTILDFNKAYNPPCVFTPYATCPLPPDGNRLAIKIRAGEKVSEHLH